MNTTTVLNKLDKLTTIDVTVKISKQFKISLFFAKMFFIMGIKCLGCSGEMKTESLSSDYYDEDLTRL